MTALTCRTSRVVLRLGALAALVLAAPTGSRGQVPAEAISYRLSYERPGADDVQVEIAWTPALAEGQALVMPRAIPMGYGEQRYDAFVTDVRAAGPGGRLVTPEREEGPRWRLAAGTTGVRYRVDLRRMERAVLAASDSSRVREGYVGVLGYSVFAYVDGQEHRPVRLHVEAPAGWPAFSTLAPGVPDAGRSIDARAPDFYALADSQVVLGPRAAIRQVAATPVPLFLAVYAEGAVDLGRLGRVAETAFRRVIDYFGGAPFPHYTIHQELLAPLTADHAYGMSMEHLDSSTYYLAAATGLRAEAGGDEEARTLYNFAHHIAHAWIPKRVYGRGYFPFPWELAPVLDSIWFAEGFGQYAAIVALAEGMPDPAAYRQRLIERRFRSTIASAPPFLRRLPLVELSRIASTRYAEDFRTGRLVFSRGGLMAAALDDRIQSATGGTKSLRDVFRHLVAWSARERRAMRDDELPDLVRAATGVDVRGTVDEWLRPLP